jgi:hypothetical protein
MEPVIDAKKSNDGFALLTRTKTSPLQFEYGRKMFAWIASQGVPRNPECRFKISMDSAVLESFTSSVVGLVHHSVRSLLSITEVE